MIEILNIFPTASQWMSLRASVGWASFPEETAQKSLDATNFCVCAMEGDELIGMGRVLGDGVFCFYIGNIMVRPERQSEGVGRAIMEALMTYVDENAQSGAIASLLSIKGKEEFYKKFGFDERPDETHGAGMSKYYSDGNETPRGRAPGYQDNDTALRWQKRHL